MGTQFEDAIILRETYQKQDKVEYQIFSDIEALHRYYVKAYIEIEDSFEPDTESDTWRKIVGLKDHSISTLHITAYQDFNLKKPIPPDPETGWIGRWTYI